MKIEQQRYRAIKLLSGVLFLALIFSSFNNASAGQNSVPAYDVTGTLTDTPVATATTFGAYFFDPIGPYCVGGGCSGPTGYNLVTSSTLNEQSMAASDTKSGFSTGRGRVETTIRVGGAGIGTVRVYVQWGAVSCSEGASILIYKLSGNEEYPGIPGGYMDIVLTYGDHGEFKILTRCMTAGRYVGPIGIDGIQYSLFPLATSTPSLTSTPTMTSTSTHTPTPTYTFTPTLTFTSTSSPTLTPAPPYSNGSGTCWKSGPSWAGFDVSYNFDTLVPTDWYASINAAAETWTNVTPSRFSFHRQPSGNWIYYRVPKNPKVIAAAAPPPSSGYIVKGYIKFNPRMNWSITHPPSSGTFGVQNVATHEFGHWLFLYDIYDSNCDNATMYYATAKGEDSKSDLSPYDIEGINYQYP